VTRKGFAARGYRSGPRAGRRAGPARRGHPM